MADHEMIKPNRSLESKVEKGGAGAVDAAALASAENVIAGMADAYLDWVQEDFVRMEAAYDLMKSGEGDPKDALKGVFEIAHDMKGQGGSFGYDLITAVGDHLCRLLDKVEKNGPREVQMVRLHIDAMRLIIAKKLKGDGGKEGNQLLMGLELMGQKA